GRGMPALARRPALEVMAEVRRLQRQSGGAAIDNAADGRAMAFAKGRYREQFPKRVAGQKRDSTVATTGTGKRPGADQPRASAKALIVAWWATRSERSATKIPIWPTLNSTQASGSSGSRSTSARS